MKKALKTISMMIACSVLVLATAALADAPAATCKQDEPCALEKKAAPTFKRGEVTGATAWQEEDRMVIWFTTKTDKPNTFDIAVCGTNEVEELRFEGGVTYRDAKTVSSDGRIGGCDSYQFNTGRHIDGLRIKPLDYIVKIFILMDGEPTGFDLLLGDKVLPARAGYWYFEVAN